MALVYNGDGSFTWEYDGTDWTRKADVPVLGRGDWMPIVYDSARGVIVEYGSDGRTLEYDGVSWKEVTTAHGPGDRFAPGLPVMAYDSRRNVTVLVREGSTWEYDGTDWTEYLMPTSIGDPLAPALAYDSARGKVVMFGGASSGEKWRYTWEYDGNNWTPRSFSESPHGNRLWAVMAYDSERQRMVYYNGHDETWEYDGSSWTRVTTETTPNGERSSFGIAYDSTRGRTVVVGGETVDGVNYHAWEDTWEYAPATQLSTPTAQPTQTPIPTPTPVPTVTPVPSPTPNPRKPAIVLVHGINMFVGSECTQINPEKDGYFGDIVPLLRDKYEIKYAYLESSACSTPRVEDNVKNLKKAIDEAWEWGHEPVTLVTHSMGGLVARAYIESTEQCTKDARGKWVRGYCGDVKEIFTFGTPHNGVNISTEQWVALFAGDCMTEAAEANTSYLKKQPVLEDFKTDIRIQFNRMHPPNPDVRYHVIGGSVPTDQRTAAGKITELVFGELRNDGIVPWESSIGLPGVMDRLSVRQAHADFLGTEPYFKKGTESFRCLERVLLEGEVICGEVTYLDAQPPPPLKIKRIPISETARRVQEYEDERESRRLVALCTAGLLFELGRAYAMNTDEFNQLIGEYVKRTGKQVGSALVRWGRDKALSTKEFVLMVATYARERGKEASGEVARILGEWAQQAKLTAAEVYELSVEAIHQKLPFFFRAVHSPATILVTNAAGQRSGVLEDGSIVEEIPRSKVAVVDGEKYVFLPPSEGYATDLKGTGTGTMTVQLVESDGTGTGRIVTHENVPVSPDVTAHIDAADPEARLSITTSSQSNAQQRAPDRVEKATVNEQTGVVTITAEPKPSGSGSPVLYVVGAGALLLLVAAAGVFAVRNRKRT